MFLQYKYLRVFITLVDSICYKYYHKSLINLLREDKIKMSDYTKTERKLLPDGTVQYAVGGSRLMDAASRDDIISKAGNLSYGDVASTYDVVIAEYSRHNQQRLIDEGLIESPEELAKQGLKYTMTEEGDDNVDYIWFGHKKYPKSCALFPGDIIEVNKLDDPSHHGHPAYVAHVRDFNTMKISCIMFDGPDEGAKIVLEGTEYKILRTARGSFQSDDYVMKATSNTHVREDGKK